MRFRHAALIAGLAWASSPEASNASYMISVQEVGGDVVASGSGALDTTDLTYDFSEPALSSGMNPNFPFISVGSGDADLFETISGPGSIGSGSFTQADFSSGSVFGVGYFGEDLIVPQGYTSGSDLGPSSETFNGATFGSLGLTTGTYVWTWGTGVDADSLTVVVGTGTPTVPLPGSAPLFGAALLGFALLGYTARRTNTISASSM